MAGGGFIRGCSVEARGVVTVDSAVFGRKSWWGHSASVLFSYPSADCAIYFSIMVVCFGVVCREERWFVEELDGVRFPLWIGADELGFGSTRVEPG